MDVSEHLSSFAPLIQIILAWVILDLISSAFLLALLFNEKKSRKDEKLGSLKTNQL